MIVSINQPAYLPWLGYFDRIAASDVHVVLDHVQFEKNSFVNRNRIRTRDGTAWLTVPVSTSGKFGDLAINKLETADTRWTRKHASALQANYGRCGPFRTLWPGFAGLFGSLETSASDGHAFLPPVEALTGRILEMLGIATPLLRSSAMQLESTKSELILDICRNLNATQYLSGPLGRGYLDVQAFKEAGIDVAFHDYSPVEYVQAWPGFHSHLSSVDALFTHGPEETLRIMNAGRRVVTDG